MVAEYASGPPGAQPPFAGWPNARRAARDGDAQWSTMLAKLSGRRRSSSAIAGASLSGR
ncbi:hypothetical protein IOD13_05275 [Brevibacterium casei]|nr:hypothetical protein [Brevibacterium casei]